MKKKSRAARSAETDAKYRGRVTTYTKSEIVAMVTGRAVDDPTLADDDQENHLQFHLTHEGLIVDLVDKHGNVSRSFCTMRLQFHLTHEGLIVDLVDKHGNVSRSFCTMHDAFIEMMNPL